MTAIYTIGYGARDIDAFMAALRRYNIAYLIDVRSQPYSRYKPDFSKDALEEHLRRGGIRYVYMGDTLGGRPDDPTCYDAEGKVDYTAVTQRDFYQAGIERLTKAWSQGLTVSLMCSEGKPEMCHRSKLIGRTLTERGLTVTHIDEHDEAISQAEVILRLTGGQLSLFEDTRPGSTSRKSYGPVGREEEDEYE
ncbi:MAG TPA: DUF488 domain-containing protein [Promineifilum sp.]|nr:DUF488 domain-containing protein [Promineifilum sp.]HRO24124.1 DUF488 domain-containing protein [Promineifilum sp.]HRO91971.1 DUF488 domain-containing protein [Promineifilum sp.]HRQ13878.1 DUF488 domain-containing protein [Promineifilum sp.]